MAESKWYQKKKLRSFGKNMEPDLKNKSKWR
jgi:hypothetical protein